MFLKNYTSEIPANQTIARIEQVLIRCGVTGITKEYKPNGAIVAVVFHINVDGRNVAIRLPADKDTVQQALFGDYIAKVKHPKKKMGDFTVQAERTAWKLMQDWVEVQLSLIQMRQADFLQVFLPYVWNGEETFYQALKANGFTQLAAPKEGL